MLYWMIDSNVISKEIPNSDFESFTPTLPHLTEGYLVVVQYKTYDSLGSSSEFYYEVIDLYPSIESAEKVARTIAVWETNIPELKKADGTSPIHEFWNKWGYSFQGAIVYKCEIKDHYDYTKKVFR